MKFIFKGIIAFGLLGGCLASTGNFEQFDGSELGSLIERAGVPDSQRTIAGYTVYRWESWRAIEGTTYQCVFEATTKSGSQTIVKSKVDGNLGGCNALARRMNL